jgi:beta-glucosidase
MLTWMEGPGFDIPIPPKPDRTEMALTGTAFAKFRCCSESNTPREGLTKQHWERIVSTQRRVLRLLPILTVLFVSILAAAPPDGTTASIYRDGWIDLNKNGVQDPYENPKLPVEQRVDDLLSRMNVEEKTCQMTTLYGYNRVLKDPLPTPAWSEQVWKDGIANIDEHLNGVNRSAMEFTTPPSHHADSINTVQKFFVEMTRLGIPVDFSNEGIRGACCRGATCVPAQVGIGSTWNTDLVREIGHVTGEESRALGYTNVYSPILDLARDPRWGRVVDCYSEDPFLVTTLGVAMARALQAEGVASTPKHFAVYSVPKGGRDGNARTDPHVALREVEMMHLAPFRAVFTQAGALGTMCSYNDYDAIPIAASDDFMIRRLRKEWGFRGYIVSDSRAVEFLETKHHVAVDHKQAVRQAVEAGLNVRTNFSPPEVHIMPLRELIKEGKLPIAVIDGRVRDVLRVKFLLGLFDRPYVTDPKKADEVVHCKAHEETALKASRQSIVLLKNEGNTLPLKKDLKSILVTGPGAADTSHSINRYGPADAKVLSVLDGIRNALRETGTEVRYTTGCTFTSKGWPECEILPEEPTPGEREGITQAAAMAKTCDAAVVVVGESDELVGESHSRVSLDLTGHQLDLVKAVAATGVPTVVVLINGRALSINWINKFIPGIVEAWHPGEYGGTAVAEVLFGDCNPGGKLPVTFPKTVGQIELNFPFKPGSHAGMPRSGPNGEGSTMVNGALYPFGHGLSYTTFTYSQLKIKPDKQKLGGDIAISADVTNVGGRDGDEVVQCYIRDVVGSVVTYEKELKGFERVSLKRGEKRTVTFRIASGDLALLNRKMQLVTEPGEFSVMVGSSSEDIRLVGSFEMLE